MDQDDGASRRDEDARLSFEQSALPQAFADLDGRFVDVNAALTALLGRSGEWFLGRDLLSVLEPRDDALFREELERLRQGVLSSTSGEVVARHADGRRLQLLLDVALIRKPDGTPRGVVMVGHDLTAVRSAEERLERQERLYRALNNRASDAAVVTDDELQVVFVSPALTDMLGHDPLDLFSASALDLVHPDEQAELRDTVARVIDQSAADRCVVRTRTAAGDWRWSEVTVINSLRDPDVGGLIFNVRDVTVELEAERAVRESEARYRAVVETAQEGIAVIDATGRVGLANDRMAEILGLPAAEVRTSGRVQDLLDAASAAGAEGTAERQELRYVAPDGGERVLSVSTSPLPGKEGAPDTLLMVSDVTEAHLLQEKLRHQALHDRLTGLPNRYLFEDRLEMAAARQLRHPEGSTAVMYVDLDGFKAVNDTFGHAAGDQVLALIGRRLVEAVRASDTVARLGGDEFAVICEGLDEKAARTVADRIATDVFSGLEYDGHPLGVGASIGIAMFPPHDPGRALALADSAMYQAKRLGSGGVIVFGSD